MKIVAGVDVGNSTTEVCIGKIAEDGTIQFLSSASAVTTGTKGTLANVHSIRTSLNTALSDAGLDFSQLSLIRLNEAAPVIGDTAMETITETIITESSMIGHNPSTPAGAGQAVGELIFYHHLDQALTDRDYIVVVMSDTSYETIAAAINVHAQRISIKGMILQADEAVLVYNRLLQKIPIIDEVIRIREIPEGKTAAIEVALLGQSVHMLSNPYGIATLLKLSPEETRLATPIAKSLIGKRSAVVIKTPHTNITENILPAGEIFFEGTHSGSVNIDRGADEIMNSLFLAGDITDINGQPETNIGNMFQKIREGMNEVSLSESTDQQENQIRITDVLAVDTLAPIEISGALAGETCMEKAVGIAAMVRTQKLPMEKIAKRLQQETGVSVQVAGVEAVMAAIGALTTPGTTLPLAMLDMGGGSTDAAVIRSDGTIRLTHKAGAGELVSMLIQIELGLQSRHTAEQIKKYPLAKVESLFHLRLETGEMLFYSEALDPKYYGHIVLMTPGEMIKIEEDIPMEKIVTVRKEAKIKVFVTNAMRAMKEVAPENDLSKISNIVLVGGSALDFEIPEMLMEVFSGYRIVCGRGNIRGTEGSRNAVATGLLLSYLGEIK
ncbi:MAG: diol dehydratase reactivase subunit alpha [Lachnospiraceae bacterium]